MEEVWQPAEQYKIGVDYILLDLFNSELVRPPTPYLLESVTTILVNVNFISL